MDYVTPPLNAVLDEQAAANHLLISVREFRKLVRAGKVVSSLVALNAPTPRVRKYYAYRDLTAYLSDEPSLALPPVSAAGRVP